ncbi:MAG: type III-A CRISPR-associated protein Csm2 [Anaerostipes sp.]|nr:type III-A CRISPR-associated protein Csm2 [Anaerostipes sp.]
MVKLDSLNYVETAEKVIFALKENSRKGQLELTTSQIRNILAMVSEIYNEVIHEEGNVLTQKSMERIQYLKLHIIYSAGREVKVKKFVQKAELIKIIESVKDNKDRFLIFCKYMEALVAYHRYYGGND